MAWKDALAKEILSVASKSLTYQQMLSIAKRFSSVRVKTTNAKDALPLIQLEDKGPWMKPSEWAENHRLSLVSRSREAQQRLWYAGCDPSKCCIVDCSVCSKLKQARRDDLTQAQVEAQEFQTAYNNLREAYNAMLSAYFGALFELQRVSSQAGLLPPARAALKTLDGKLTLPPEWLRINPPDEWKR